MRATVVATLVALVGCSKPPESPPGTVLSPHDLSVDQLAVNEAGMVWIGAQSSGRTSVIRANAQAGSQREVGTCESGGALAVSGEVAYWSCTSPSQTFRSASLESDGAPLDLGSPQFVVTAAGSSLLVGRESGWGDLRLLPLDGGTSVDLPDTHSAFALFVQDDLFLFQDTAIQRVAAGTSTGVVEYAGTESFHGTAAITGQTLLWMTIEEQEGPSSVVGFTARLFAHRIGDSGATKLDEVVVQVKPEGTGWLGRTLCTTEPFPAFVIADSTNAYWAVQYAEGPNCAMEDYPARGGFTLRRASLDGQGSASTLIDLRAVDLAGLGVDGTSLYYVGNGLVYSIPK